MLTLLLATALAAPLALTYPAELLPHQGWPALEGEVTGLLVEAGSHEWGSPVGWTGSPDRPNYCAYRFFTDGQAPWAVYFEDRDGVGHNHLRQWRAGSSWTQPIDSSMFCSTTGRHGLDAKVHVVRVEVNHGEPVKPNLHFVITAVERLNGTDAVPMDPEEALIAARRAFDEGLRERRKKLDLLWLEGERVAKKASEAQPTEHREGEPDVRVFPSWNAAENTMQATFVWVRQGSRQFTREEMWSPRCPPGAPCVPPRMERITSTWGWAVETAAVYTLDAKGQITDVTWHEPKLATSAP
ncbi:MAG: hypothetical protein EP330_10220 [Deltaproteobacteria bacterium]|nr:MAG: hypothetical protein EP330_10220 [Deltaproteobacteria bacterium]